MAHIIISSIKGMQVGSPTTRIETRLLVYFSHGGTKFRRKKRSETSHGLSGLQACPVTSCETKVQNIRLLHIYR